MYNNCVWGLALSAKMLEVFVNRRALGSRLARFLICLGCVWKVSVKFPMLEDNFHIWLEPWESKPAQWAMCCLGLGRAHVFGCDLFGKCMGLFWESLAMESILGQIQMCLGNVWDVSGKWLALKNGFLGSLEP